MPYSDFDVFLDGNSVDLNSIQADSTSLENDGLLNNQILFSLNITRGQHNIDVNYKGYPSEFLGD